VSVRILLVGYGRMGRLVAELAPEYDCEVAGSIDVDSASGPDGLESPRWDGVDVAIDFSWASAVPTNVPALARRGINLVIGTTGWQEHEPALRRVAADAGIGLVAAPNFATGVVLFESIAAYAAKLFSSLDDVGAWVYEAHHAAKKDAPSGTARQLEKAMIQAGYSRPINMCSTRAGHIPGTHTIGFDAASESLTLTHTARDRGGFARGALVAAKWVNGKRGWFSMKDVLGIA
jgi:4-hydroxy-tetrahydrodipicolinate reductase